MEFRISSTFTSSLGKLGRDDQKAVKMTAFDLQVDPANPGLKFHKVDRAKDPNFWSVRASRDLRLIVHRTTGSLLLCYVGHHDDAYQWAERRKMETHPTTGAAQLVKIRETIKEVIVPRFVDQPEERPEKHLPFEEVSEAQLLGYGVPEEWLDEVREADEDTVLQVVEHLPEEAAEALLELATGGTPVVPPTVAADTNPFEHPDAQRRFRVVTNVEDLEQALEAPWEKWVVFLHPTQRDLVEREFNGPARVAGSAGTGKTIVALHRAVHLARENPGARVLLTTFSDTLANGLRAKLKLLAGRSPRTLEFIEVHALDTVAGRLHRLNLGEPRVAEERAIEELLEQSATQVEGANFSLRFLRDEWNQVVDAWQITTWEEYRDVLRLGRKTRLSESRREILWQVFEKVREGLKESGLVTQAEIYARLTEWLDETGRPPFDFAVVDEAQDISVPQLRFLASLGNDRPNSLFFSGDLGQRIFRQPFSWKALGVDIRGRSSTLRINYRTSHQIRKQVDRLLPPELADVDGVTEDRRGTISVFNGPLPEIATFEAQEEENDHVGTWIQERLSDGLSPHEIGVFVRSKAQLDRAKTAAKNSGCNFTILDDSLSSTKDSLSIGTMHLAKGLEFRAVAVMACDDTIIPLEERMESLGDLADLEETYTTERHLLYVACTRARDHLLITAVEPASEFLDDLGG